MGTVNYNCPSCAAPLTFTPKGRDFVVNTAFRSFRLRKFSRFTLKGSKAVRTANRNLKRNCTMDMCSIAILAVQRLLQHHQQRQQPAFTATILLCSRADCREISDPTELFRLSCHENKLFQLLWIKQKAKSFCPKIF